ncbi:hypothetical protein GCM10028791_04430 [Echinicola sediminis]
MLEIIKIRHSKTEKRKIGAAKIVQLYNYDKYGGNIHGSG